MTMGLVSIESTFLFFLKENFFEMNNLIFYIFCLGYYYRIFRVNFMI